jgi:hypothetical protein
MVQSQDELCKDMKDLIERLVERLPPPGYETSLSRQVKEFVPTFMVLFGLGGQIIFTVITTISINRDAARARTLLSVAWLFFAVAFEVSCVVLLLSQIHGKRGRTQRHGSDSIVIALWAFLQIDVAVAFLFLSLVIVAYTPAVGWVAFGLSCLWVLTVIASLIIGLCC